MSKLRLDYFLSKCKLVEGDVVERHFGDTIIKKHNVANFNRKSEFDHDIVIKSLATRKNTGDQPCGDDVPVVVEYYYNHKDFGEKSVLSGDITWSQQTTYKSWTPDLQKLIEMQTESDKLTSSDIDWLDDDVVAVIENGEREVHLRFSFEPKDCIMSNDKPCFKFSWHKFSKDCFYLVYQEANKTVEAVNRFNGEFPFFAVESGEKLIIQSLTDDSGVKIGEFDFGGKTHNKSMFLQVCTETEFNQCVTDLSEAAWLNKDAPGEPQYYEMHKKAVNDMEAVENKSVYTQAMKDAGELPSVGMECVIALTNDDVEATVTYIGDKIGCATSNKTSAEFSFTCRTGAYVFNPIDTRTPAQKQVDEVAKLIADVNIVPLSFYLEAAENLQKAGLLAEIK